MLGLAVTARADSAASSIQIYASVNENGVADVTMTVRLRIEAPVDSLSFPLPLAASDIKLNDRNVTVNRSAASTLVPLDDSICESIGDHVLTFKYKISISHQSWLFLSLHILVPKGLFLLDHCFFKVQVTLNLAI